MFKLFWEKQVDQANHIGVNEPVLPRKRKAPKRFEVGSSEGAAPSSAESHYKFILRLLILLQLALEVDFIRKAFRCISSLNSFSLIVILII